MADPAEILVRGHAEVRVRPDRALLWVRVEADGESRQEVFAAATRGAADLDAVMDRYAAVIERRNTIGVMLRPRVRWDMGQSLRTGWIASRTSRVDVSDLAAVGPLVTDLSAAGATDIRGPEWEVAATNPAHETARAEAARDARHRASAYAEAQGLRLGALRWLAEPGLRGARPPGGDHPMPLGARSAALSGAPGPQPMTIDADAVSVESSVEACFEVETGA